MESKRLKISLTNFIGRFSDTKIVLVLFALTFFLRLVYLDYFSLNFDEPFTVFYSQMSFEHIGEMLKTENNPPLFFVIMHYWIKAFGISEFSVRFLPAFFSALTVVFVYLIGIRFFCVKVAVASTFLFVFSESHFEFSHDCRAYSMLVLLSSISVFYLLKLLILENDRKNWILFGICNILLVYTHFIGWIIIFVEIVVIISEVRYIKLKHFVISYSITLLSLSPYLSIFVRRVAETASKDSWVQKPHLSDLYSRLWEYSNKPVVTVIFLFVLLTGFGLLIKQKNRIDLQTRTLLLWFLIPYLGLYLISMKLPLFIERYLLVISIPFYILLGIFAELLSRKAKALKFLYLFLPLLMLLSTNLNPSRNRPNKQIVQLLQNLKRSPSTAILINPDWYEPTFLYYYDKKLFCDYNHSNEKLNANGIFRLGSFEELVKKDNFKKYDRIVYFQSNQNSVDFENRNLNFLKSSFKYVSTVKEFNCQISILNRN